MPLMPDIAHLHSIRHIPPDEWDALAGEDVLWRHGWLVTREEQTGPSGAPWYLVARDGTRIVAAAAGETRDAGDTGVDRRLFGAGARVARALGGSLAPLLVCGSRIGLTSPICVRPDCPPDEALRLAGLLLDTLIATAEREGRTLCVDGVTAGSWLEPVLARAGLRRVSDFPSATLDVTFPDFDGYLRQVGAAHPSMPRTIQQEQRRARKHGVTIERVSHPGAWEPTLHQLLDGHSRRLNGVPSPLRSGTLSRLAERLGDRVVIDVAWRDSRPIGVALSAIAGDTLLLLALGVDPAHQRETLVYFVLAYDVSIALALRHGLRRIVGGRLAYDVKLRRGFHLQPLHMYFRARGRWAGAWLAGAAALTPIRLRTVPRPRA